MLLTLSTTHRPATDLGFLLHKNPDRLHDKTLTFGRALMAYPEAGEGRCTFALAVEVDPVALVRGKGKGAGGLLDQYVNDRPYAASSLLCVAITQCLRTAMTGRCKQRQDLADTPIPLEATVSALAARGREGMVGRLFEPLGYTVEETPIPLDETMPELGEGPFIRLRLSAVIRLAELLTHLYVLIPVLDGSKHYYLDRDEVEKLLAKGEGWLEGHPERDFIVRRYLRRRRRLVREALERLATEEVSEAELAPEARDTEEEALEKPIRLHDQRLETVAGVLSESGARRVLDLGCGEGKLLRQLLADRQFTEIVGMDTSVRSLERAADRLKLDRMSERQRGRIALLHGALTYRDRRLEGYDAAALVEVIEHLDEDRLPALERVVFRHAKPETVVVTTPNREYNVLFEGMPRDRLRHPDHRFEWTRAEFRAWAERVAAEHGYGVRTAPIGAVDAEHGAPSQMAVFERGVA